MNTNCKTCNTDHSDSRDRDACKERWMLMQRFEIKALKVAEFASEETTCYQAKIYVDGKAAVLASNDGHGGCDRYEPIKFDDASKARFADAMVLLEQACEGRTWDGFDGDPIDYNVEMLVGDMITEAQATKDVKAQLRRRAVFTKPDAEGVWQVNIPKVQDKDAWVQSFAARHPEYKVLNLMPLRKAVEIYLEVQSGQV